MDIIDKCKEICVFKSKKGSITVFQCLIFLGVFIFSGVLIDLARIFVAERKVQSALDTSLRSVLADYDQGLIGDYGIFGVDTQSQYDKVFDAFSRYLSENILEKNQDFRFIDYNLMIGDGNTLLSGEASLLEKEIFRKQVLEYMKYRAPLSIAEGIIDKFRKSGLGKKVKFAESEKRVRNKYTEIKKTAEAINDSLEEAKSEAGLQTVEGLKKAKTCLIEAEEKNSLIPGMISQYSNEVQMSDKVLDENNDGAVNPQALEINNNRISLQSVLDRSLALQVAIIENTGRLNSLIASIEKLQSQLDKLETADKEADKKDDLRTSEIKSLRDSIKTLESSFQFNNINGITLDTGSTQEIETTDSDTKTEANGLSDKLKNEFEDYLKNIDSKQLIQGETFSEAEREADRRYENMELQSTDEDERNSEAEEKSDGVLSYAKDLLKIFENQAETSIENIYTVEYIMEKYTYLTSKAATNHYLQKGEVEYILWGGTNQLENIIKTMGSIWFLRFSIDTIDSFATSPNPEPITRLIGALITGFMESCKDMVDIYNGKEISLCPSVKNAITVNYADHLRAFLLLKSFTSYGQTSMLNNMRQLIQVNQKQQNNSFELKNYNTMLYGKAEVGINLWFLPLLQVDKLGLKNLKDGRYIIRKTAKVEY